MVRVRASIPRVAREVMKRTQISKLVWPLLSNVSWIISNIGGNLVHSKLFPQSLV